MALEHPACPLCGADAPRPLAAKPEWTPHRVVACGDCRFVYLSPRPSELEMRALYESDSYFEAENETEETSGYDAYAEQELALRLTFRRWLSRLAGKGHAGGSMLEIGCGHGYLLDEAAAFFGRREGTEYSIAAAHDAAKVADEIHVGGIDAVPADRRYDLVVSNQVIEHVYAPLEFLKAQLALVKPGGTIAIATPWMRSPWQRVLGERWPSYKIPEHVLYFDSTSLTTLMRQAGLQEIERLPYPHAFPLSLVAAKLGMPLGGRLGRTSLWIPGTTLAMLGVRDS
jgi:SAM-dependent methyltransferase